MSYRPRQLRGLLKSYQRKAAGSNDFGLSGKPGQRADRLLVWTAVLAVKRSMHISFVALTATLATAIVCDARSQTISVEGKSFNISILSLRRELASVEPEINSSHVPGFDYDFLPGCDGFFLLGGEGILHDRLAIGGNRKP
jgi:hypothetical protein